jgi:large subunit ribosomal protein L5
MFGFDVCVSLSRRGRRVMLRKLRPAAVGKRHRVSRDEAMEFAKSTLNVKVE